jgi:nicotinamide-nucleotide amidase
LTQSTESLVNQIAGFLTGQQQTVTTVESCTGGGVAYQLTAVAGSSNWFEKGFVTYSNQAKTEMVGVAEALIEAHGAVSIEVAAAMAEGGRHRANASYAVSITGIAGPGGGTPDKPVGTVCFGWASPSGEVKTSRILFKGDRVSVRLQSVNYALAELVKLLTQG